MSSGNLEFPGLVAVHLGAGYHSPETRKELLSLAKSSCRIRSEPDRTVCVRSACAQAITTLENDTLTNAGVGSNLTVEERVECDASMMSGGRMSFGAVAALSGVRNPIRVAEMIMRDEDERRSSEDSYGLMLPMVVAGDGGRRLAELEGLELMSPEEMVTGRSLKDFQESVKTISRNQERTRWKRLDTVGAIALDKNGGIVAGCSSGGVLLKQPGRVGQAGTFGAGCWAEEREEVCVAASVSGSGESIIRTQLARESCRAVLDSSEEEEETLPECLRNSFLKNLAENEGVLRYQEKAHRLAGILLVKFWKRMGRAEIVWCHNTLTMCVGYSGWKGESLKSVITELDSNSSIAVHGVCV